MILSIRSLVLLLLCLVGVGIYRGWFSFSTPARDPQGHKVNLSVSVDTDRVKADADALKARVAEKVAERSRQFDVQNTPAPLR